MTQKALDLHFMNCALQHAASQQGLTWPNPWVGAVLVRDGGIVATAATALGGRPHAETQVLATAGKQAEGGVLYVTLEPCSHQGQTPPCVDAIIAAKVARVVVAMGDPDPRVNGQGIKSLQRADIHVDTGVLAEQAQKLYRGYAMRIRDKRPWVTIKMALSQDGKIAARRGQKTPISCPQAIDYVHWLRLHHDAILVGIDTALGDDPLLTCRLHGVETQLQDHLARVIIDADLRLPLSAQVFRARTSPLWLITRGGGDDKKADALTRKGCQLIEMTGDKPFAVRDILEALAARGICRLLVEGGAVTVGHFMDAGCVDEIIVLRAPQTLGAEAYDGFQKKELQGYNLRDHIYMKGQDRVEHYDRV